LSTIQIGLVNFVKVVPKRGDFFYCLLSDNGIKQQSVVKTVDTNDIKNGRRTEYGRVYTDHHAGTV